MSVHKLQNTNMHNFHIILYSIPTYNINLNKFIKLFVYCFQTPSDNMT